jgi:hypothetical protein
MPAELPVLGADAPVAPSARPSASQVPDDTASGLVLERRSASSRLRLARVLAPAAAVVLMVTAGAVYWARSERQAPVSESSPQASVTPQAPASSLAPAVASSGPAVPPRAGVGPGQVSPPMAPPGAWRKVLAAPKTEPLKLSSTSPTHPFISVRALPVPEDRGGLIRLEFTNNGKEAVPFAVDLEASEVWDVPHHHRYRLAGVLQKNAQTSSQLLRPGQVLRMEFQVRPDLTETTLVELTLVSTPVSGKAVRFTSFLVPVK